MRLFLARHGETEWNVVHRLQGRSDIGLTPRGRAQAAALAERLRAVPLDAIYTSTLRRTIATAAPLAAALHLLPEARPELDELSHGVLEGRTPSDPDPAVQRLFAARRADPLAFRAPGGESYAELQKRLEPFVRLVRERHAGGTVLVVGHRATNRVLRALLLGRPLEAAFEFKHKHDRLFEIRPGAEPECTEHRYAPEAQPRSES
jgi:probable phosphoglycerate mutase